MRKATTEHNYLRKMMAMPEGKKALAIPGMYIVNVSHDDWCDALKDEGYCNCDPTIKFTLVGDTKRLNG